MSIPNAEKKKTRAAIWSVTSHLATQESTYELPQHGALDHRTPDSLHRHRILASPLTPFC
jgi:hypothetical protein